MENLSVTWLFENYTEIIAWVGALVSAVTALVSAFRVLIGVFRRIAEWTTSDADDQLLALADSKFETAANWLGEATRRLDRFSVIRGDKGRQHTTAPRTVYPPVIGMMLFALMLGCGSSALARHTTVAGVLNELGNGDAEDFERRYKLQLREDFAPCLMSAPDPQPALTCVQAAAATRARYRRWQVVHNLIATALDSYVDELDLFERGQADSLAGALVHLNEIRQLYEESVQLAAAFGYRLPPLPASVTSLLGGGR
jgi:hypothetical protein